MHGLIYTLHIYYATMHMVSKESVHSSQETSPIHLYTHSLKNMDVPVPLLSPNSPLPPLNTDTKTLFRRFLRNFKDRLECIFLSKARV